MNSMIDPEEHWTSLRLILSTISEECRELGEFMEKFQSTLSPALLRLGLDIDCHRDVQSLDLLSQRLMALSCYISQVSVLLPEELRVDSRSALASVTLSELQYRLKGSPLPQDSGHLSGELELF